MCWYCVRCSHRVYRLYRKHTEDLRAAGVNVRLVRRAAEATVSCAQRAQDAGVDAENDHARVDILEPREKIVDECSQVFRLAEYGREFVRLVEILQRESGALFHAV